MAISNKPTDDVHPTVNQATMARVFNLRDVCAVVTLMEAYQDSYDFAQAERTLALAALHATAEQLAMPTRFKDLAEVIGVTEQVF